MYIELMCKKCDHIFDISLDEDEIKTYVCPNCNKHFNNEQLSHLAEVYFSMKRFPQNDFELISLAGGEKSYVFSSDINSLNRMYNDSSDEIRLRMSRLFDLFYLLMFRDGKHYDFEELDRTIDNIRRIYNRKCGHPENFMIDGNYDI